LQKEPSRRYESSLALADDLKRYLEHRPILARPAGRVERTWRWCRRNPRLAGTGAVASLLLVFWVASMVSGYYKQIAARQKDHFLINDMFTEISEDDLLNQPGMQKLRGKLLGKALTHYQELLQDSGGSQWLQDEVAGAHFRIGVIRQQMGQYDESRVELASAASQQQRLLDARPSDPERLEALSDTLTAMGKLHSKERQLAEATELHAQADALRARLIAANSTNLQWQRKLASARANLGLAELDQGRIEIKHEHSEAGQDLQQRGREHIRQAQEIGLRVLEADPTFEAARRELAMSYFNLGKFDSLAFFDLPMPRPITQASGAVTSFQEAIKHFRQLNMKELANRSRLATVHLQLGGLLVETEDLPAAQQEYEAARPLITTLALGNPDVLEYQVEFVSLAMIQGDMYERQKDAASAQEAWTRARDALIELLGTDSRNYRYRYDLATALDAIAEDQHILGNLEGKITTLDAVLGELRTLMEQAPDDAERKYLLEWESQVKADRESARATLEGAHPAGTPLSNPPETADKNQ
jgi:tetratricopeptide (TPR) repeat protein